MGLTVSEAIDVCIIARYLLDFPDALENVPEGKDARDALGRLCQKAHIRLQAGVTPEHVQKKWPEGGHKYVPRRRS